MTGSFSSLLRHPRVGRLSDYGLAIVLGAVAELDIWFGSAWPGPRPFSAMLVAVMAGSLVLRRSKPLLPIAVAAAVTVLQAVSYGTSDSATGFFLVVVAVYSAAAHSSRPWAAAALTAVGVVAHDFSDPRIKTFGDAVYDSVMLGLVVLVGIAMRARQTRTRTLEIEQAAREQAVVEEERRRIARELHDIISHSLGVVVLQAGAAERMLDRDVERARLALQLIRTAGLEAVGEMETLLALVRGDGSTPRQPQPRLADVEQLAETMRAGGMDVRIEVVGERRELPAALELSAYRIVQEGLTNAAKHAPGAPVVARVAYHDDTVTVEILDRGRGDARSGGSRRGLAGISERVSIFGGRFEAGPRAEGGWAIRAVLPVAR